MTREEMDQWLESIGGLQSGYLAEVPPITNSLMFEVDDGWMKLLKDLIQDLIQLGWDRQICQVKEKFGGLRFYINEGSDVVHDRIREAENLSLEICEVTGEPGELRGDLGWWRTLSDAEYLKAWNERAQLVQHSVNPNLTLSMMGQSGALRIYGVYRIIGEGDKIEALDPSGGPLIGVGSEIQGFGSVIDGRIINGIVESPVGFKLKLASLKNVS
jgi:hypothetical protein